LRDSDEEVLLLCITGNQCIFRYLETQNPRHEPQFAGDISDNVGLSENDIWSMFERWLIQQFPQATTLATPFNDPVATSIDEYQSFLKTLGTPLLRKRLLGRKYKQIVSVYFYKIQTAFIEGY
jgi:hypothetical protein